MENYYVIAYHLKINILILKAALLFIVFLKWDGQTWP